MYSIAIHSYNEASHLERLFNSLIQIKDPNFKEVVIVDHRSEDNTEEVICNFKEKFEHRKINFISGYESREFSNDFKFANLKENTLKLSTQEFVFTFDSDFLVGPNWKRLSNMILDKFTENKNIYSIGFDIPCINDYLKINKRCKIEETGRVLIHPPIPRAIRANSFEYRHDHCDGMFEWCYPKEKNKKFKIVPRVNSSILSCNIKDIDKKKKKVTLFTFHKMLKNNKISGTWKENFDNGNLSEVSEKNMKKEIKHNFDIVGEVFFCKNLEIGNKNYEKT
jgi:glycosyltransferase involved in cell wall biosynthesis